MTQADPASALPDQPASVRIFLSYAHDDEQLVGQIARELTALGLSPFMAIYHLHTAKEWLPRIEVELRRSYALIAFLSPAFRASAWTNQEVGYALALGKKILPAQLAPQSPPDGFLQRYQALVLVNGDARDRATSILDWLLAGAGAGDPLPDLVTSRLRNERSEASLHFWVARLAKLTSLSADTLAKLEPAIAANAAIQTNQALSSRVREIIDRLARDAGFINPR